MSTFPLIHCDFCPIWLVFDIKQFDEGWDIVTLTCLTSLLLRNVCTSLPLLSEMYSHPLSYSQKCTHIPSLSPQNCTHISSLSFKNVLTSSPLPSEMYTHPLTSSQKSTFIPSEMYSHPLPSLRNVLISPPFPSEIYILSPSLRNVLTFPLLRNVLTLSFLHLEMYSHALPYTLFNLFGHPKHLLSRLLLFFFSSFQHDHHHHYFFLRRNHSEIISN